VAERRAIATDKAPAAIGPYSQAVVAGELVFCSGQIALDPVGQLVGAGDVRAQAEQVVGNLTAVLEASGSSWKNVVKATIFLKSMDDFAAVNEVYGAVVSDPPPARACVEVARLPKDVLVEIDAIATVA